MKSLEESEMLLAFSLHSLSVSFPSLSFIPNYPKSQINHRYVDSSWLGWWHTRYRHDVWIFFWEVLWNRWSDCISSLEIGRRFWIFHISISCTMKEIRGINVYRFLHLKIKLFLLFICISAEVSEQRMLEDAFIQQE